jgi:UDP-N-acetyl-D-mannosaminuronic acid dehydrogenase
MLNKRQISIIGGAGHVGFPLGLIFSSKGFKVNLIDKNLENINKINLGVSPFLEEGSQKLLSKMLKKKRIKATNKIQEISNSKYIIICIGTPIDNNLSPEIKNFLNFFRQIKKYLIREHQIIIRSSVFPGICEKVFSIIKNKTKNLSYCPERIVQGKSIKELPRISQIVSGKNKTSINEASNLFRKICKKIIKVKIIEAELVKLFSNAYRYVHFAISNQFYMICKKENLNFFKIREIMKDGYKRNAHIPMSGFTAGPCLLKDTMQLSSFYNKKFPLGTAAMNINEGMPKFIVDDLKKKYNLKNKTIGLLGLTFKGDCDDIRDSLAIKLLKYLKKKRIKTIYSDEYYNLKGSIDKNLLVKNSDIVIISTPHSIYKKIKIPSNKILVDIWGLVN